MAFESTKATLLRHKVGAQRSPAAAIVLVYSRSDRPDKMRKRVMPLRGLRTLEDPAAIARLMIEAHAEFLDPAHVSFEQITGLCAKLQSAAPKAER